MERRLRLRLALLIPVEIDLNFPSIQLAHLDHLWFQVSGTLCNLACTHCFNSSGPGVRTFGILERESVETELAAAVSLGVREVFFTGGEPFMHKQLPEFIALSLKHAPTTVLTNGLLITAKVADELAQIERASRYSLEIRISLDGYTAEMNDAIRGEGVFHRVLEATARLSRHGLLPLITIVRTWPEEAELETIAGFTQVLRDAGYARPRIKIIPALPLGRELTRTDTHELSFVTEEMLRGFDRDLLMCSNSRIVTDRGVWVCPLLVEKPDARMGAHLTDSLGSYELRHPACHSCYLYGTFCQNINSLVEGGVEAP